MAAALFYLVAAAALASALAMVAARNVVHAVLYMVLNFVLTAVLYVMLSAPFLAVTQVTVYAGAIMVLFLFVMMLLGQREASLAEPLAGHRPVAVGLLLLLGGLLAFAVVEGVPAAGHGAALAPGAAETFGSPAALGDTLFRDHVLAFEVIGALLLVAVVGAVRIGHAVRAGDGTGDGR